MMIAITIYQNMGTANILLRFIYFALKFALEMNYLRF